MKGILYRELGQAYYKVEGNDQITIKKLWMNQQGEVLFVFNWIGGGFNDEWGMTELDAIEKAESKTSLRVNTSTIRPVTLPEWEEWNEMGNRLTN